MSHFELRCALLQSNFELFFTTSISHWFEYIKVPEIRLEGQKAVNSVPASCTWPFNLRTAVERLVLNEEAENAASHHLIATRAQLTIRRSFYAKLRLLAYNFLLNVSNWLKSSKIYVCNQTPGIDGSICSFDDTSLFNNIVVGRH